MIFFTNANKIVPDIPWKYFNKFLVERNLLKLYVEMYHADFINFITKFKNTMENITKYNSYLITKCNKSFWKTT